MGQDHELLHDVLHSLNQWEHEEWGFAREGRLFTVPIISLADVDRAVAELEWALANGARTVAIRPAPVPGYRGGRSPGAAEFDPFWARVNEARIFVCLHSSDSGYDRFAQMWIGGIEYLPFQPDPFRSALRVGERAISDTISALICHGVFDRHPDVRVVSVENGAMWVEPLLDTFKHIYGQMPQMFKRHPVEIFKRHIFVAPYYEEPIEKLAELIGVSQVLYGSDYPHPEGLADPLSFIDELKGMSPTAQEQIMSLNLQGLLNGERS